MTLIVVSNGKIICDSFCSIGGHSSTTNKVRTTSFQASAAIKYTCAGSPDTASEVMEYLAGIHASNWLQEDLSSFGDDVDNTIIVFRRPSPVSNPLILALGVKRPRISVANAPDSIGLQFMAGSAWNWFHAYMVEHGDLDKALELTARHHRDVAGPFSSF